MRNNAAYWIDPTGRILPLTAPLHITQITDNPEKFGLSRDYIKSKYEDSGEKFGVEGRARESIIKDVLKRGFIRIRLYKNERWSVTLQRYGRPEKKALQVWAREAAKNRFAGPHMPVYITDLSKDRVNRDYTVSELAGGDQLYEDVNTTPRFTTLDDFGISGTVTLKEFIRKAYTSKEELS